MIGTSTGEQYQDQFEHLLSQHDKEDTPDYDYASARAAGVKQDERGHWPDTYKLPNHITFSDESIHNKGGAGHWEDLGEDKWSFTPGAENLKHHSMDDMRKYFKEYEPDATLIEPKQDQMPSRASGKVASASKQEGGYLPSQFSPAPSPESFHVDRTHDVPLAASALHKDGEMYGVAIDKDAPHKPEYDQYIHKHESDEFHYMKDLMTNGMNPTEAYHKAHDHITPMESARVQADLGEKGLEDYKQYWRAVAAFSSTKEDPKRHPDAHTTVFGLDESELGRKFEDGLMHAREFIHGSTQPTKEQLASGEVKVPPIWYDIAQAVGLGMTAMGAEMASGGLPRMYKGPETHWTNIPERVEAAKKLGFDQPTFHGTPRVFEGQKLKTDKFQDMDSEDRPFYSTSSPDLANKYAGGEKEAYAQQHQVVPLVLRTKNYHEVDAGGHTWAGKGLDTINNAIDHALTNGKDGVIVRNIHDEPAGSSRDLPPKDIFITLKGSTARSWFAKFDPAKMDLNDLLASGLAVAMPAGTMSMDKEK